jgi:hypothetical protein
MAKQTPEGRVKAAVKLAMAPYGVYYFMPVSNGMGVMGAPDILACLNGRFIAIEVKAGKNKPTALQIRALQSIHDAGGLALVINDTNLDYLKECLYAPRQARSNFYLHCTASTREFCRLEAPQAGAAQAHALRAEDKPAVA